MKLVSIVLTLLVALLHIAFMILEMVFWDHPIGHRVFSLSPELAAGSAQLAFNQGLYNGFLAAGLVWAVIAQKVDVRVFFLICVVIAGIVGAITAKPSIFVIQALPAIVALVVVWFSHKQA